MKQLRDVEYLDNGDWKKIKFKDLKKGMTFRIVGEQAIRSITWTTLSDAYKNSAGIYIIDVEK